MNGSNEIQTNLQPKEKTLKTRTPKKIVRVITNTSRVTAGEPPHSGAFGKCS